MFYNQLIHKIIYTNKSIKNFSNKIIKKYYSKTQNKKEKHFKISLILYWNFSHDIFDECFSIFYKYFYLTPLIIKIFFKLSFVKVNRFCNALFLNCKISEFCSVFVFWIFQINLGIKYKSII